MTLYEIITSLMNTSGSKAKKAILEANKDNALLSEYLRAAYDPRIMYYMKKLPEATRYGNGALDLELIEDTYRALANRGITGKTAKAWVKDVLESLNEYNQVLFSMMLGKDIRAGVGSSLILDVFPGLFYVPPYQRCAGMDEKTKERFAALPYFYVQLKSDGQFCYAVRRSSGEVLAMTRTGSLHPQWVAEHITRGMPFGHVAMGELLVYRNEVLLSRKEGNGILNSLLTGDGSKFNAQTDKISFVAWDMVTEYEFDDDKSERDYFERFDNLTQNTSLRIIEGEKVTSLAEAAIVHNRFVARKEEGSVWKNPDMGWRDCSSGDPDMMKVKVAFQAEFRIDGCYEGEGKAKGMLGGLNVSSSDDLMKFNVGTGFSDELRIALWAMRDQLPGRVCTLEGNDIVTSKGKTTESVFLPAFIEMRPDRIEADNRARVLEQFEAAKEGRKL